MGGKQDEDSTIMKVMHHADVNYDGVFDFAELIDLIWSIRKELLKKNKDHLKALFMKLDKDHDGDLSIQEVNHLFAEMNLVPKNKTAQNEIKRVLDFADVDHNNHISFQEFVHLTGLVREKLRTITRIQELELGHELGLTEELVREYRDAFWELDEDGSGQLDIQALRKAMRLLKQRIDGDNLRKLFMKIDNDGNGVLDFSEFLRLMHVVDEQKKHDNYENHIHDMDTKDKSPSPSKPTKKKAGFEIEEVWSRSRAEVQLFFLPAVVTL